MKLYKSRFNDLYYLAGGQPFEDAICLSNGKRWSSFFRSRELVEKPHLFKLVGNNYRQK